MYFKNLIVVFVVKVLKRLFNCWLQETKRPSKEMQVTIARQLGLEPTTVGNFFMNARRRSMDKWKDEDPKSMQGMHLSPGGSGIDQDDPDQDQDLDDNDPDLDDTDQDVL